MNKKGFTLMEVLVVVLIIAVLFVMYSASYDGARVTRRVEKARAMFVEFTNAAKLFNEMFPNTRLVGRFGTTMGVNTGANSTCPGCIDPCNLFEDYALEEDRANIHSYALKPLEWDDLNAGANAGANCSEGLKYKGQYDFILCNPYFDSSENAQPDGCNSNMFAIMNIPDTNEFGKYKGKHVWMTRGYEIQDDFDAFNNNANQNNNNQENNG